MIIGLIDTRWKGAQFRIRALSLDSTGIYISGPQCQTSTFYDHLS